jgi:uncharacterized membrane protein YhiD involved in acid resistance
MFDSVFTSIYGTSDSLASQVSSGNFLLCCLASIILGLVVAGMYMFKHKYSKNFVVTLALLPLIVQAVITLVNGNLGAGIAVMGVFNLVRFRSIPGSAKDIGSVFFSMAIGLATGMGYLTLAVVFAIIVAITNTVFVLTPLGTSRGVNKSLTVTVPEDLDFDGMFDNVLAKYADDHSLQSVETTNMGSLFKLTFDINLRSDANVKAMIDEIRALNGNLKVVLHTPLTGRDTL